MAAETSPFYQYTNNKRKLSNRMHLTEMAVHITDTPAATPYLIDGNYFRSERWRSLESLS
jgi:hypothetical protein